MKKFISVFLTLTLMLTVMIPAAAAYYPGQETPIIYIGGDSTKICDSENNVIWPASLEGTGKDKIVESVANILFPHFINGMVFDKWDGWCDAFYEEISPVFVKSQLDKNGEASNGSGISKEDAEHNRVSQTINTAAQQGGRYGVFDYTLYIDWRLSPSQVVDDMHAYITAVMETTGASQVSLIGRCLGTSFLMAYLAKYGKLGHIKSAVFDSGVVNGCAMLSDVYQGKLEFDAKSIERFLYDYTYQYGENYDELGNINEVEFFLDEVIRTSISLLNETGVTDVALNSLTNIYSKVYTNIVPRLLTAMFVTWPGYWTNIDSENYDACVNFIFGSEGTEKREEYAGLIEKLDWYNDTVGSRIPQIISECEAAGVTVAAMAKYGYQLYPFIESQDEISDGMVLLDKAAFGATVAKQSEMLSPEYIDERTALGFGSYLSNDKAVDASTSLLKDTVWIIKGISHNTWTPAIDALMYQICQGRITSVNDSSDYPQFMVYDAPGRRIIPMTDKNCVISNWDDINTKKPTLLSRLVSLFKWLYALFRYIFTISKDKAALS